MNQTTERPPTRAILIRDGDFTLTTHNECCHLKGIREAAPGDF